MKDWIPLISLMGSQLVLMGAMFAWGWRNLKKDIKDTTGELKKDITSLSEKVGNIDKRGRNWKKYS